MKPVSYAHIWKIAFPILISLVAEHLIMMTDTAFLGRVGEVELGASALAGVFFLALFMIGFGFSMGAQILIGRRNGEKRFSDIGPIVIQGGFFLIFLALVAFLLSKLFSPIVLQLLFSSEKVYEAAVSYLDWRSIGFFFVFVCLIFRAYFVGIEQTRILTISSFLMVGVNIVLNYLLIFGKGGLPKMGIGGAALASSIAEGITMLFFIFYMYRYVDLKKYGFSRYFSIKWKGIVEILSVGIWMMIQYLIGIAIWFMFFVAIEHLGERAIAVSNITRSILTMIFMPIFALSSSAVTITSNLMGAGEHQQVMGACWKVIKLCFLITLPAGLLIFFFPGPFIQIYTDYSSLITESSPSVQVAMSSLLISIPAFILFQTISGTGNTKTAFLLDLGPLFISCLFIYWVIVYLKMDVAICWLNEHVYWGLILIVSLIYMKKSDWKSKKI